MIILSENFNVIDSVKFLNFIKEALIEDVSSKTEDESIISFIENADNCDILSLSLFGKTCPSKDRVFAESAMLNEMKHFIVENNEMFHFNEIYSTNDFLNEIDIPLVEGDTTSEVISKIIGIFERHPKEDPETMMKKFSEYLKSVQHGSKYMLNVVLNTKDWLSKEINKAINLNPSDATDVKNASIVIGSAFIVGTISFISYKIYQRFYSVAAKQCMDKKGTEKTVCMYNVKRQAFEKQISALNKSHELCKNASDPLKCNAQLNKEIKKLEKKIKKL